MNSIHQSILEIDFDRTTHRNEYCRLTFWTLGISKNDQYSVLRNTFQCHRKRILETMSSNIRDRSQTWKIYKPHFKPFHSYFALSGNRIRTDIFLEVPICRVQWLPTTEDLHKSLHSMHAILSNFVVMDSWNALFPIVMDCRLGRSNQLRFCVKSIPPISSELPQKLFESLPIVPI